MIGFTPSRNIGDAELTLATLIKHTLKPLLFSSRILRLQRMYSTCCNSCLPPFAGNNLQITPEINYQCEQWLPLEELRPIFYHFYRHAVNYPPLLSSTPFVDAASWAGIVSRLPSFFQHSTNPAELLEQLLTDEALRINFLFCSFMPGRFYGAGSDRYPDQTAIISEWLRKKSYSGKRLRCLDAASGDGANTYALARQLAEQGWLPDSFVIEGWSIEPLEVWSAAHGCFPHDRTREKVFREETIDCFRSGLDSAIRFCIVDILNVPRPETFDLILCNGLLGGPIIHERGTFEMAVSIIAGLLAPGGLLLAADHFHGGWKQKFPQQELRELLMQYGLVNIEAVEGVAVVRL